MAEVYAEYEFKVNPVNPGAEILIAELSQLDFESFDETDEGVKAYILASLDKANLLDEVFILNNPEFEITYSINTIEPVNWNEEWEKNFEPIEVDGICSVRAPFHPKPDMEYDIVIEPKMSFGTGHHETTHLMIKHLIKIDVEGKSTLDMGCGTGILAIFAALKGAKPVDAIDIDPWCFENTVENKSRNDVDFIKAYEGDATMLGGTHYDLIIANINRNILLQDIPTYAKCLNHEGILLLSGFYTQDIPAITNVCNQHGLNFIMNFEKNNWVACKFVKN